MCARFGIIALFALVSQAHSAGAESVSRQVGGESIDFVLPKGQCLLMDNNPYDAQYINLRRALLRWSGEILIVAMMACDRRAKLREGDTGDVLDHAEYYTPGSSVDNTIPSLTRNPCDDVRVRGADVKDIIAEKAEELRAKVAVKIWSDIGVLDEDQHGCYFAGLTGVQGAGGKAILISSILTSTAIRSKPLFLFISNEYKGAEAISAGVEAAQAAIAELHRKNP